MSTSTQECEAAPERAKTASFSVYDGQTISVVRLFNESNPLSWTDEIGFHLGNLFWREQGKSSQFLGCDFVSIEDKFIYVGAVRFGIDLYTFLSPFKVSKMFIWKNNVQLEFDFKQGQFRGVGAIRLVEYRSSEGHLEFLVSSGQGTNQARVNRLVIETDLKTGRVHCSAETILSISANISVFGQEFSQDGRHLVVSYAQDSNAKFVAFPLDNIAGPSTVSAHTGTTIGERELEKALGSRVLSEALLKKRNALSNTATYEDGLADRYPGLFPARLLDPYAYEGEVNASGDAHGHGTQLLKSQRALYVGQWSNGYRQGSGMLLDEKDETRVIYKGHFIRNDRSGFGTEHKEKETYNGYFEDDVRHGFGVLTLMKDAKVGSMSLPRGTVLKGFYKKGRLHGLSRIYYPSKHFDGLGKVGSVSEFQNNVCYAEFSFFALDGPAVTQCPRPELLGSVFTVGGKTVSLVGDSEIFDDPQVCWACIDTGDASLYSCALCGFSIHSDECFGSSKTCPFDSSKLGINNKAKKQRKVLPSTSIKLPAHSMNIPKSEEQRRIGQGKASERVNTEVRNCDENIPGSNSSTIGGANGDVYVEKIRIFAVKDALDDWAVIHNLQLAEREEEFKKARTEMNRKDLDERRLAKASERELIQKISEAEQYVTTLTKERDSLKADVALLHPDFIAMDDDSLLKRKQELFRLLNEILNVSLSHPPYGPPVTISEAGSIDDANVLGT